MTPAHQGAVARQFLSPPESDAVLTPYPLLSAMARKAAARLGRPQAS